MDRVKNLDDFGFYWFNSVSIMTEGTHFEWAVDFAKKTNMRIGLHLTLTEPRMSFRTFLRRYFTGKIKRNWIYWEWDRQIKIFKGSLPLHRVDSHHGVHYFPACWDILMILMKKHKITFVRNPPRKICWFHPNIKIWISRNKAWLFWKINKQEPWTKPLPYKEEIWHLKE